MMAHILGAQEIIKARGPAALQSVAGHMIIREMRQNAVRQRSHLSAVACGRI